MFVIFPHRDTIINLARYDYFEPTERKLPSGEIVYGIAFRHLDEGFDLVETLFIPFPDEKARGDAWRGLCAKLNISRQLLPISVGVRVRYDPAE